MPKISKIFSIKMPNFSEVCAILYAENLNDRLATSLYEAASLYLPGIIDLHVRGIISYVKG